jgi:hypothetical protein
VYVSPRMIASSTVAHDTVAMSKLSQLVADCMQSCEGIDCIGYAAENRLRDSAWAEEHVETLRRCAVAALSPAFEGTTRAEMERLGLASGSSTAHEVSKEIAYAILELSIRRLVQESVDAIHAAQERRDSDGLRVAIDGARQVGESLVRDFYFFDRDGKHRITEEDFRSRASRLDGASPGIDERGPRFSIGGGGYLVELSDTIDGGSFALDLFTQLPHAEWDKIARDREIYGAKGAFLRALSKGVDNLRPFLDRAGLSYLVPDFTLIPAAVYDRARHDPSVSQEVRAAYEWIGGRCVMVRSSAVHSEDGEHLGAGVYSTFRLPAHASFEVYCEAVKAVYASTESPLAREYRRGIEFTGDEKMGVILQEYQEGSYQESAGHINTCRFQIPKVIDVTTQRRSIPAFVPGEANEIFNSDSVVLPLHRLMIERELGTRGDRMYSSLVLPSDHTQESNPFSVVELGKLGVILEMYFGRPMQLEFVEAQYRNFLVQARPLPESWCRSATVQFPERGDFLWQGASFGVLDDELEILGEDETNCERSGLVIIDSGWMASEYLAWLERVLPKKGAVWVLRPSEHMRGHIESRCAERGILVITGELLSHQDTFEYRGELLSRLWKAYGDDPSHWLFSADRDRPRILSPHEGMKQLRVVSDGLEARVYA